MKDKRKLLRFLIIGQTLLVLFSSRVTVAEPPAGRLHLPRHHQNSGIEGQVLLRFCGLAYPSGELCVDSPYQTSFTVYTDGGRFVTRFVTDPDGTFSVSLRPGRYVLVPFVATSTGPGGVTTISFPIANPVSAEVKRREFVDVTIIYDSGNL